MTDLATKTKRLKMVASPLKLDAKFYDPERDGVTYSVLETFRSCREKSRLGLRGLTSSRVSASMTYGTIAHAVLQTVYDDLRHNRLPPGGPTTAYVANALKVTEAAWKTENPRPSTETLQGLEFSMALAEATMPTYFRYWKDDFNGSMKWLGIEKEFRIPIRVAAPWHPNGEVTTFVRGKMDGNYEEAKDKSLMLFETKTKYNIDEETLVDLLPHELQVNIYMWAMRRLHKRHASGVRYNLIRRPALRQKKTETMPQFAARCADDVRVRPDWYFVRLDMASSKADHDRFEGEFEDLLQDFIAWWYGHAGHYKNSGNCENKYGRCQFLSVCGRKDYIGLYKRPTVFRELEEV